MQTSGDVGRATPPDANIRIRGISTWKPATQLEPAKKKQHAFRCKDGKCLVIYALHVNESSESFLQGRCAISCWSIQCWQIDNVRQSGCASAFALTDTAMVTNDQLCISAMKFSGLKLGFWVSASVPSNFSIENRMVKPKIAKPSIAFVKFQKQRVNETSMAPPAMAPSNGTTSSPPKLRPIPPPIGGCHTCYLGKNRLQLNVRNLTPVSWILCASKSSPSSNFTTDLGTWNIKYQNHQNFTRIHHQFLFITPY